MQFAAFMPEVVGLLPKQCTILDSESSDTSCTRNDITRDIGVVGREVVHGNIT